VAERYWSRYSDFGPAFAVEKLAEETGVDINVSADTHSGGAVAEEPVQFDGSPHDWLEGRGAHRCLITMIDDATKARRKQGIEVIPANSPQAKGREERNHGVDQDRLVKDISLRNYDWPVSVPWRRQTGFSGKPTCRR
jgi:hypothetical protein